MKEKIYISIIGGISIITTFYPIYLLSNKQKNIACMFLNKKNCLCILCKKNCLYIFYKKN